MRSDRGDSPGCGRAGTVRRVNVGIIHRCQLARPCLEDSEARLIAHALESAA